MTKCSSCSGARFSNLNVAVSHHIQVYIWRNAMTSSHHFQIYIRRHDQVHKSNMNVLVFVVAAMRFKALRRAAVFKPIPACRLDLERCPKQ